LNSEIEIYYAGDQTLSFKGLAEVREWLQSEREAFRWLLEVGLTAGPQVKQLSDMYRVGYANIDAKIAELLTSSRDPESSSDQLSHVFQRHYNSANALLSSDARAKIAISVAEHEGPIAGCAAFATLLKVDFPIERKTAAGMISAILLSNGIEPRSQAIVLKQIDQLTQSAATDRETSRSEWVDLLAKVDGEAEKQRQVLIKKIEDHERQLTEFRQSMEKAADASLASIKATESAFREQMELQAPVHYWQAKATEHRKSLEKSRWNLVAYAIGGSLVLVGALILLLFQAAALASVSPGSDAAIYLKFAAIGAIVTTIGFWVGRVLLRIYLSDRHLTTDAEERVALIKTFLALSVENKVESADRAIILAPIFRSASDGIVKDDGPDTSMAGLVAKLIDVRK
jgi:hypothetical protein